MSQTQPPRSWDQRYQTGDLPWDSGIIDQNLLDTLRELGDDIDKSHGLEIGCGTGTNAIALAQHGFAHVTAMDISPKAVEMAKAKAHAAAAHVDFRVHDIIESAPVPPASVQFAFDRGVFHSVPPDVRPTFARRVADALPSGGWWLTICGNADDTTTGGPPRMTAALVATLVEPMFVIHAITRSSFRNIKERHSDSYLCWRCLLRKR